MSNTYQVAEVSVTLPAIGTVSRNDYGNVVKHNAECRVHLYAVHPEWREQGSAFKGFMFMVGSVLSCGYTEAPTHHTQRILMPDGYKLLALSVDHYGVPTSWDSLPVLSVGGIIESGRRYAGSMGVAVEDGDKRVRFLAESFKVGDEPILRAEVRPIGDDEVKTRLSDEMREAVIDAVRKSDLFKALQASQDAQVSAQVTMQLNINQAVTDAIRNAVQPGGMLHRR